MRGFHLKTLPFALVLVLLSVYAGRSEAEEKLPTGSSGSTTSLGRAETDQLAGLCVQVGGSLRLTKQLSGNPGLLLHRLDSDAFAVANSVFAVANGLFSISEVYLFQHSILVFRGLFISAFGSHPRISWRIASSRIPCSILPRLLCERPVGF